MEKATLSVETSTHCRSMRVRPIRVIDKSVGQEETFQHFLEKDGESVSAMTRRLVPQMVRSALACATISISTRCKRRLAFTLVCVCREQPLSWRDGN
jgi:hypothetical protein